MYTLADNGYVELAGWWPDGRGLLFWSDPAGSASIAADGLDLDSLELSTLELRTLATTLVHPDWLAWARTAGPWPWWPVATGNFGTSGKHVELCAIPAATCRGVALAAQDVMSLDPGMGPRRVFQYMVLAPAVGPAPTAAAKATAATTGGPGTWDPSGPWSSQNVAAWYAQQRLFSASPAGTGAHALAAAGTGAHNPVATVHGLLYVQGDLLRYLPDGPGRPVTLAHGLQSPGTYADNYYGYIAWSEDLAYSPTTTVGSTRTSVRSELAT